MFVAKVRYIQSMHEDPDHRNPDTLVRSFLSCATGCGRAG